MKKLLPAVFWIGVWELAYYLVHKDLLLASPLQVLKKMSMAGESYFWSSVGMTVFRSMFSWLIAIAAGTLLAILCRFSNIMKELTEPLMSMIRSAPVASFIILALIWLGSSDAPILAGFLMSLPIIYTGVTDGIRGTDRNLLEMADMFSFGKWKTFIRVELPSFLPGLGNACITCIGLCFKATVAAEVIGVPKKAIGSMMYDAKKYMETDALIAWTLVVILLSIILEKILGKLIRKGITYVCHT